MNDVPAAGATGLVLRDMGAEFAAMLNTPEMVAARSERARIRNELRARALAEYGSEEAVWAPCDREKALEAVCSGLIVLKPIRGGDLVTLEGWNGGSYDRLPPEVQAAVAAAWTVPGSPRAAWAELTHWRKRRDERRAFFEDHEDVVWLQAREALIEHLLDTLPAVSLNDVRARLDWMDYRNDLDCSRGPEREGVLLARLRADIERMADAIRDVRAGAVR